MTVFYLNVDMGEDKALQLLQGKKSSECVTVETKLQIVPTQELTSILESLSRFDHITRLFIKRIVALPARALTNIIRNQSRLEFLYLQNVSLSGERQDFQTLALAIRQHEGLRKVRFYMLRPSLRTTASLNPIVSALGCTPRLEEVSLIYCTLRDHHPMVMLVNVDNNNNEEEAVIVANDDDDDDDDDDDNNNHDAEFHWDGQSVIDLCSSKSLKVLTLTFGDELQDIHIEQMAQALSISKNSSKLQNISIRAHHLGPTAGVSLGKLLDSNSKLQRLRIQLSSDEHAVPIVEALHRNTNLQRLGLVLPKLVHSTPMRTKVLSKLINMLRQSNYDLQQMDYVANSGDGDDGCHHAERKEEIRFYCKVNQAGRKSLMRKGATRREWMQTLSEHNDDLSVLYYFLSRNPSLCLAVLTRMKALEQKLQLLLLLL